MVLNEDEIVLLLEKGDERCMRMIFDLYYHSLCAYGLKFLSSLEDVEDVVQNVLVSFWELKRKQRFVGSVRSYLFGAVTKASLKFLKQHGTAFFDDIEMHVNQLLEEELDKSEEELESLRLKLEGELTQLPERARAIFFAIVLENLSYKEVAMRYDISINTVKTHYALALKKLRKRLGDLSVLLLFIRKHVYSQKK